MGRPRGPVREVTELRRRVLQALTARETEWLSALDVREKTGDWLSATHNSLRTMTLLGWVEVEVDLSTETRPGAVGRRVRRRYRVTPAGKTMLTGDDE